MHVCGATLLLFLAISIATADRWCYVCNSSTDQNCYHSPDEKYLRKCHPYITECLVYEDLLNDQIDLPFRVRACHELGMCNFTIPLCCWCTWDGCNIDESCVWMPGQSSTIKCLSWGLAITITIIGIV